MSGAADPGTLTELLRRARPADPAAATFLEVPGGVRLSYADVELETARLANALAVAGVRAGDRVAVQAEKSPLVLLVYLACIRSGAVFLPMNTAYTAAEVDYLLGDAEPAVFVCDPARADEHGTAGAGLTVFTADAGGVGTLADLAASQPSTHADVEAAPGDTAAILYTSGTTGRPKGAVLSHRNLTSNALALHRVWGFRPDDVLLHALPVFHAHGLFVATNCVLANGTGMVFLPRFDPAAIIDQLPRSTVFMGVPTFYTRLLTEPSFDASACRTIRLFISGSAPLLAATHAAFRARTGQAILERYGMTETTMLTSNPLGGERRPGSVGFPLPGVEVRVTDGQTTDARPAGEAGAVEVRGPNVFAGYWRRPDLAATEFTADGWFRTGDLGRFDADGYLHLVGRSKDLIISGGLNVYPPEVEAVLDDLDGVVESAVIGLPDADFGEMVVAVLVTEHGATLDAAAVRAAARLRLAGYKVPRRVEVVDALPRNTMGKVEKATLRSRFASSSE